MINHLIKDVRSFLIIEKIDFIGNLEQTFNLLDLVIDLSKNIIHHKKVLIVIVKQSKYDFDTININLNDIDKK